MDKIEKILVMATGDIVVPLWADLIEQKCFKLKLVTQPDRKAGRKRQWKSPVVKIQAEEAGIEVWQPSRVGEVSFLKQVEQWNPDLILVMAYGQILPKRLIKLPKIACINLHASLLPKYRGASCITQSILDGEIETGLTAIHVAEALDAGDIIVQQKQRITQTMTGGQLESHLAGLAVGLMRLLLDMPASDWPKIPQDKSKVTYVRKLKRNDAQLDWSKSAEELKRKILAYDPWPGTYTYLLKEGGKRIKLFPGVESCFKQKGDWLPGEIIKIGDGVLTIACGKGSLNLFEWQMEGNRKMTIKEFLEGHLLCVGDQLIWMDEL